MDDAFDRLLAREEEIRRRVEAGDISDDEADALLDLIGDGGAENERSESRRMRITTDQLARIVDEGIDPESLREMLELAPSLSLDEAIDLIAEYDPSTADLHRLAHTQQPTGSQLRQILEHGIEPEAVESAARYGCDQPISAAIALTERGADVVDVFSQLGRADVRALSVEELCVVVDEGIDVRTLAQMLRACDDLPFARVLELCVDDVDPDAVRRLRDEGFDIRNEARPGRAITLGFNINLGRRHLLVGTGRERIRRSGTVTGVYVGNVTIDPGLTIEFAATLIGDLHIGAGAEVDITGRVTGDVTREHPARTTTAS